MSANPAAAAPKAPGGPLSQTMMRRMDEYLGGLINQQRIPCAELLVSHKGKIVCHYKNLGGLKKPEGGEFIYRQYSMTKPVVTCAVMALFERGLFQLNQPVYLFLGDKWKKENMMVLDLAKMAETKKIEMIPCQTDITLGQLMTHTSGLSHGLSHPGDGNPLDDIYTANGISADDCILLRPDKTGLPSLQVFCEKLSECPLLFQPGANWNYSYGMEVMGRIVELLSGASNLDAFIQENICKKLGMTDTTFFLSPAQQARLCPFHMYYPDAVPPANKLVPESTHFPVYCSGSAGLFSTTSDYHKFSRAILRGGLGDNGQRILSSSTVEWMMQNHLRKGIEPTTVREMSLLPFMVTPGFGFGFGGSIATDSGYDYQITNVGEFSWAGATSTEFWVDFQEDLVAVFMTSVWEPDKQKFPLYAILHAITYGALNDTQRHPQGGQQVKRQRRRKGSKAPAAS
jgi:CubicO group peptidase (beta-lactamase class C family)